MDLSKAAFLCTGAVLSLGAAFGLGLHTAATQNSLYRLIIDARDAVRDAVTGIEQTAVFVPGPFLQPARRPGDGVTVNQVGDDGALVLMAGLFENGNQLRLVRRDGSVVARWPVRFSELLPTTDHMRDPPATDWNVDTHGALALPDGSVVFNFEYAGLVKLDRCGRVAWTLAHPTHHSVERAEGGGFWVPGQRHVPEGTWRLPPFPPPYREDLILRVSAEGEILTEISVPELMYANGLEPLLTATGHNFGADFEWDEELVHLNKIEELTADRAGAFPGLDAGDLMLSLRDHNMLLAVDPRTSRVKWHQTGPWRRQHDPEFAPDGTVVLFNNATYQNHELYADESPHGHASSIQRVDPSSRRVETLYGARPDQRLLSIIRGKVDLLAEGGLLITEFEGGRVIETDAKGETVWEYVNRYDESRVAEITEARLYPEGYFTVGDWSCPGA